MNEQEKLESELNSGILITLEAVDMNLSHKIMVILETALKYEFKDSKFAIVIPMLSSATASAATKLLSGELYDNTRLLLSGAVISETDGIIRNLLKQGVNVICTSYITNMILELSNYYTPTMVAAMIQLADLTVHRDSEIIIISSVPENHKKRLQDYHDFVTSAMNGVQQDMTSYYRIDASEKIDDTVQEVISIIKSRLAQSDNLKSFAKNLFEDAPEVNEEVVSEETPKKIMKIDELSTKSKE
jgi:thymidylate kinase